MKKKAIKIKVKVGVGRAGIKAIAKDLRKQYGPMLKRLAE
jgi:N-acetylglutamate synthase/N-acetylornithine aminotransferase